MEDNGWIVDTDKNQVNSLLVHWYFLNSFLHFYNSQQIQYHIPLQKLQIIQILQYNRNFDLRPIFPFVAICLVKRLL